MGNRPQQSYGMMHRTISLDFSKSPVLKIAVESVTHHWYMIMNHADLNKGFVRRAAGHESDRHILL